MSLLENSKKEIIAKFAKNKQDTGSTEVQCAIITGQIESLSEHLKSHKADFSSRRGLLILVSKRRRLLDYLKSQDAGRYDILIKKLNIRK